jgi:hypothetical protein
MSNYRENVVLRLGIDNLNTIIGDVLSDFDWFLIEKENNILKVREKDRFDYYNPLEMDILMEPSHVGTRLDVSATNSGYGPVQDEYIKGQVVRFLMAVRKKEDELREENIKNIIAGRDGSLSKELEKLARLHEIGELTDEEFRRAKERVIEG